MFRRGPTKWNHIRFFNASKVANTAIPVLGLGALGLGVVQCMKLIYQDEYYGETAVCKMIKDVAVNNDDLEIKMDSPLIVLSNLAELTDFYKSNKLPRRAFSPACEKISESAEQKNSFRTTFFVKGPNDGYSGRKVAQVYAEVDSTDTGVKMTAAMADIYDIEDVIAERKAPKLCRSIMITDTREMDYDEEPIIAEVISEVVTPEVEAVIADISPDVDTAVAETIVVKNTPIVKSVIAEIVPEVLPEAATPETEPVITNISSEEISVLKPVAEISPEIIPVSITPDIESIIAENAPIKDTPVVDPIIAAITPEMSPEISASVEPVVVKIASEINSDDQ